MWYHHLITVASRFKAYKKYVYQYTTESRNGVVGTANLRNGPKVSCQVHYCLCPTLSVHLITECVYLSSPMSLHWYCVCCHISLGRDRSTSDLQIHHAHKGLCSQWGVGHQFPGQAAIHAGLHLWVLPSCYGEVSSKYSSHNLNRKHML